MSQGPYEHTMPMTPVVDQGGPPGPPGRWGRRAVVAVASLVLIGAGVGVGMAVDTEPTAGHAEHAHDSGHDGDGHGEHADGRGDGEGKGHHDGKGHAKKQEWASKYGVDRKSMSNLPDVDKASEEERRAATDLLARTKEATAPYADVAKATAAGYDLNASLDRAKEKRPRVAQAMERMDRGEDVKKVPTLHVGKKATRGDGKVLDPSAPETLMFAYEGDDKWKLVGVMFTAGESLPEAPPNPTGPILRWHYHDHGDGNGGHRLMTHVFFPPDGDLAQAYAATMDGME